MKNHLFIYMYMYIEHHSVKKKKKKKDIMYIIHNTRAHHNIKFFYTTTQPQWLRNIMYMNMYMYMYITASGLIFPTPQACLEWCCTTGLFKKPFLLKECPLTTLINFFQVKTLHMNTSAHHINTTSSNSKQLSHRPVLSGAAQAIYTFLSLFF